MPSSISPHASSDHHAPLRAWGLVAAGPLLWLATLQTGYVLAYEVCAGGTMQPVWWTLGLAIGGSLVVTAGALRLRRAVRRGETAQAFLGHLALLVSGLMVLVLLASTAGPLLLRPCD